MLFSERPDYRIDNRTIKRGSRPSVLTVSFVESSYLCTLAFLQSSLLVLIWILSWCGLGACRACHDKAKFTENGFPMRLLLRFRFWRLCRFVRVEGFTIPTLCTVSLACFNILTFCSVSSCRPISNKIGFTRFGLHLQKLWQFWFSDGS